MDNELNNVLNAVIELQLAMEEENYSQDVMETKLLEVLSSIGIDFSR